MSTPLPVTAISGTGFLLGATIILLAYWRLYLARPQKQEVNEEEREGQPNYDGGRDEPGLRE